MRLKIRLVVGWLMTAGALILGAAEPDGAAVFERECASCHNDVPGARAPARALIAQRSAESVLSALTAGVMRPQGSRITGSERRAVAEFITGKKTGGDVTGVNNDRCSLVPAFNPAAPGPKWTSWGGLTNTRFQLASDAGLTPADLPRLRLKWAFGFPDATSAWSQPTVVSGRLFVGSHNGTVYSMDAKSGCVYWAYSAKSSVRSAIVIAPLGGGKYGAIFGDTAANLYALDVVTGKELWQQQVDDHPFARATGSPSVYQGTVYVGVSSFEELFGPASVHECCTFRGSLSAFEARTGKRVWKTYLAPEAKPIGKNAAGKVYYGPSGAGIWSSPTIDAKRGVVYAATGNTYTAPALNTSDAVIAFEMRTGKIRWTKQVTPKDVYVGGCRPGINTPICPEDIGPDFDFGQSPILGKFPNGRDVIVIGQKSGVGYALDPDKQGAVIWQYRAGEGSVAGGMEWGSAVDGANAYFPNSDFYREKPGGLHAVNLVTGERIWYAPPAPLMCDASVRGCNAALLAAITVIPGAVFASSNDGGVRAHSTKDGSILWEYNTNREFETRNGVSARGASIHSAGPTVVGGMVFVNSGYGDHGGRAGNVLLAFGLE